MCIKVFKICIALCQYLFLVSSNNEKFLWEMRILKCYFLHKVDKNEARIWSDFCKKKKKSPLNKKKMCIYAMVLIGFRILWKIFK